MLKFLLPCPVILQIIFFLSPTQYRKGIGYIGCVEAVSLYVERGTGWISGLSLLLAFFQLLLNVTNKISFIYNK
ncbi:hypothetical protein Anas_05189 [Armadillidium nasatum]|uniref:Uncharacterized protein n=1 Tax=Armadillidium nasatum TaxID=96803 RepID=A0A5N5SLM9_9CRUS|nr:hypothetical protein Anas_05189 [Armadillidium nasatum]